MCSVVEMAPTAQRTNIKLFCVRNLPSEKLAMLQKDCDDSAMEKSIQRETEDIVANATNSLKRTVKEYFMNFVRSM